MMKITIGKNQNVISFQVEGELTYRCADELRACWQSAAATQNGHRIQVDLDGVTFTDEAGRQLLCLMHSAGVELKATNILMRFIVDEITKP